jgi:pyrroline-5-carboxylate reductase
MANKETIAVIGAGGENARLVVSRLAYTNRQILLMDADAAKLNTFFQSLSALHGMAHLEILSCCREASWEADMIILSADIEDANAVIQKMRDVARNKVVIILSENGDHPFGSLPHALPFSRIVLVQMHLDANKNHSSVLIEGTDCDATTSVAALFESIGLVTAAHSVQ